MTLLVEVYEADNTTLAGTITAGQYRAAAGNETINLRGGGRIELPHWVNGVANPAIALATPGRIIRFSEDGDDLGQLVIEVPDDTVVAPDSEKGEVLELTGREPLAAALDKVVWYPDRGLDRHPFDKLRPLSFAADRLRDDDPAGPQGVWQFGYGQTPDQDNNNWFGRGIGYYDTVGPAGLGPEFIAAFDSRITGAPAGRQYYRQRVTFGDLGTDYDVLIQWLFDDEGEGWVDNVPGVKTVGIYKGGCNQTRMTLAGGVDHLIAGFVDNLNAERIGVAFAGWLIVDGQPTELLFRSDATACRVLPYPADPPGFTPTEVLRLGLDEAGDRGLLVDVTPDFTSAAGSPIGSGAPMTEVTDLVVEAPGSTIYTTGKVLGETYLDLVATANGKTLKAYPRGTMGIDRTATHQYGPGNCASIKLGSDFAEQATVAIVTVDDHPPFEVVHPDAAGLGRKEMPLDLGPTSPETAAKWARLYLDEISNGRRSIVLELSPGVGPTPMPGLGDTIALAVGGSGTSWGPDPATWGDDPAEWTEAHRVMSRGFVVGHDSKLRRMIELDQPRTIHAERLQNILRRHLPGSGGARTVLPSPSKPSLERQENGSEHTETWSTSTTGEVVIRKNGVAIAGSALTVDPGDPPGHRTLLDPARQYVPNVDKVDFTVGGVAGFPAEWSPPEGSWLLAFIVTAKATGLTIALKYA